jgi:hypothetical protein
MSIKKVGRFNGKEGFLDPKETMIGLGSIFKEGEEDAKIGESQGFFNFDP